MKRMVMFFMLMTVLSGCAGIRVNVDYNSCEKRGSIDGVEIARCKYVELK